MYACIIYIIYTNICVYIYVYKQTQNANIFGGQKLQITVYLNISTSRQERSLFM